MLLRRQQLVWLDEYGWFRVLSGQPGAPGWDLQALECLEHWAERRLPLVVTPQIAGRTDDGAAILTLGLPAPAKWGRRRLLVESSTTAVHRVGEFPLAASLLPALPAATQRDWAALCEGFDRLQLTARIYGSYGWQQLTGLDHLHPNSDIDLQVMVTSDLQADAAVGLLAASGLATPRLDGEICFADGASVAWREWAQGRAGQMRQIVVKGPGGATLQWLDDLVAAR
ncbi:MAG: malonate decarboxylase holo-[acyl-carrier-protein] synthase [Rubrivivax sp.]